MKICHRSRERASCRHSRWLCLADASYLHIADPTNGQVALQARVMMQGQNTLITVRLKVDRGKIQEIEHLWAGGIANEALELLTTPRSTLLADIPPAQRTPRDVL